MPEHLDREDRFASKAEAPTDTLAQPVSVVICLASWGVHGLRQRSRATQGFGQAGSACVDMRRTLTSLNLLSCRGLRVPSTEEEVP